MRIIAVFATLLLAACAEQPASPVAPASLGTVAPEYYSRTLHYTVRERHRGRVIQKAYDIPVRVERKTGEIQIQQEDAAVNHQIDVIQQRIDHMKGGLAAPR